MGEGNHRDSVLTVCRTRNDEGTVFLGDGSLAAAPPKLQRGGIRPVIKVIDDRCL